MNIRKDDKVVVLSGKDKGKQGKVLVAEPKTGKVIVEGVNVATKHKKQAGHMGVEQVTVQNLDVVKVDAELNLIAIRGAVPGPKGSIVYIKDTVKTQPVKKGEGAGISVNPQKASARVNPQKASARTK